VAAVKQGEDLVAVIVEDRQGRRTRLPARQFIDASDEGDLAALAGVAFRVGREGRTAEEPHAGRIFTPAFMDMFAGAPVAPNMDPAAHWGTLLPGSDGKGDGQVQAYTFVACLKDYAGSGNDHHLLRRPAGYDRKLYEHTTLWSRLRHWPEVAYAIPNRKCQFHWAWYGSDRPGWSNGWPTGTTAQRDTIYRAYRDHILGFLYYLQHEAGMTNWGLADDEFVDNDHFPPRLYVREARRICGQLTLNESDLHVFLRGDGIRPPLRRDSIAVGDWPMDSHAIADPSGPESASAGEGTFFLSEVTPPFQVPYGIMLPQRCQHLLVPVACSATHVAFGALRVEQCRAAMGQAAGTAAALAVRCRCDVRDVPVAVIQESLLTQHCLLHFYRDLPPEHPAFEAIQQLSLRGAFRGDKDRRFLPDAPITRGEAASALVAALDLPISITGTHFRDCPPSHRDFRAVETLFDLGSIRGKDTFRPNAEGCFRPDQPLGRQCSEWLECVKLRAPAEMPAPLRRADFAQLLWKALQSKTGR
jgi:hypothetical protein